LSKLIYNRSWRKAVGAAGLFVLLTGVSVLAQTAATAGDSPRFTGALSCASSSCHGGGGERQNQWLVWSLQDFHSQRPVATLATARARQLADALQINDPAADARCTSCHAPLQEVPSARRGAAFSAAEGVSCECCHGPAENWLRSHTRPDWTHADRVFAGLRDLQNLYVRANTCVACHQTVSVPLLNAGHPELIFELDGQCAAEPRHWREQPLWNRAQSWFVGQAVALREMSWQLARETPPDAKLLARWRAVLWLLQKLDGVDPALPSLKKITPEATPDNFRAAKLAADALAQAAASQPWSDDLSRLALQRLAGAAGDFSNPSAAGELPARRAERLVLALDRLVLAQKQPAPSSSAGNYLNQLFKQAQSAPDFDASAFAATLNQFAASLKNQP
jgi:hypothetical protein